MVARMVFTNSVDGVVCGVVLSEQRRMMGAALAGVTPTDDSRRSDMLQLPSGFCSTRTEKGFTQRAATLAAAAAVGVGEWCTAGAGGGGAGIGDAMNEKEKEKGGGLLQQDKTGNTRRMQQASKQSSKQ
jgi:hypothetical protein